MTKIIHCRVENILGVEEVDFAPNGQSITIGGANGQGKSSAIWALVMALGGKSQLPAEPVHRGAEKGAVRIQLNGFNVEMDVNPDRSTKLRVTTVDGARYASPQAMLDKLFGNLAFDPGEFKSLPREKRLATLQNVVGIDLSAIDELRTDTYDERREASKKLKEVEILLQGRVLLKDVGDKEVSLDSVAHELESAHAHNRTRSEIVSQIGAMQHAEARMCDQIRGKLAEIAAIENDIKTIEADRKRCKHEQEEKQRKLSQFPEIECEPIVRRLAENDARNRAIRENMETNRLASDAAFYSNLLRECEQKLEKLDAERRERLAAAPFPIENLSFEKDDVTYNGIPFAQISESEQWEVSTAIGFALNKSGIVFMSNCGGLDAKARERVRARAAALGVQLFLEVVDDARDVQILIEEGKVVANRLEAAEAVGA